jgi:hypothetical protein
MDRYCQALLRLSCSFVNECWSCKSHLQASALATAVLTNGTQQLSAVQAVVRILVARGVLTVDESDIDVLSATVVPSTRGTYNVSGQIKVAVFSPPGLHRSQLKAAASIPRNVTAQLSSSNSSGAPGAGRRHLRGIQTNSADAWGPQATAARSQPITLWIAQTIGTCPDDWMLMCGGEFDHKPYLSLGNISHAPPFQQQQWTIQAMSMTMPVRQVPRSCSTWKLSCAGTRAWEPFLTSDLAWLGWSLDDLEEEHNMAGPASSHGRLLLSSTRRKLQQADGSGGSSSFFSSGGLTSALGGSNASSNLTTPDVNSTTAYLAALIGLADSLAKSNAGLLVCGEGEFRGLF